MKLLKEKFPILKDFYDVIHHTHENQILLKLIFTCSARQKFKLLKGFEYAKLSLQ